MLCNKKEKQKCFKCYGGFEAIDGKCVCSTRRGCMNCHPNHTSCLLCNNGLSSDQDGNCACQANRNNCSLCSEDGQTCTWCQNGYSSMTYGCIPTEGEGCKTPNKSTMLCEECFNGLKLEGNVCNCQERLNNCWKCSEHLSSCIECHFGYEVFLSGCRCSLSKGCAVCKDDVCIEKKYK